MNRLKETAGRQGVAETQHSQTREDRATLTKIYNYARGAAMHILWAIGGLVMSRTQVFSDYAPFGLALVAGAPRHFTMTAALGALLGYFIPVTGGSAFRYITAVFAIAAIKWLLHGLLKMTQHPIYSAAVALAVTMVTGVASVRGQNLPYSVVMLAAEGLLTAGATYFIYRSTHIKIQRIKGLSGQELASVVIALNLLLLALIPISIGDISLGRILVAVLVLAAGRYGRESAGAIAGVASGFILALSGEQYLFAAGAVALGGLLSGVFAGMGRVPSALSFVLAVGLTGVVAGGPPEAIALTMEALIGAVAFLLIPQKIGLKLAELFSPPADLPRLDGLRKSLVMRLEFASEALSDVSETVEEVAQRLRRRSTPNYEDVLVNVENDACKGCTLRMHCWETVRPVTVSAMVDMTKAAKQGSNHPETAAGEEFINRCLRPAKVGESLTIHFAEYAARQAAENRIDEVRSVVSDQFDGISDMLADLAEEFEHAQQFDTETAARIVEEMLELGILVSDCGCSIDKFGRMSVEIRIKDSENLNFNRSHIMRALTDVCERDFDPPCINKAGKEVFITLSERAVYSTDVGVTQYSCGDARMCGDAYQYFNDGKGRAFMILSDGMGTGGRAAVDGAMASGLMARLIKAGFGFDCSLRIVNSAMLFKSTDESLATLDIACVDLFTGQADLLKAGAAPTVVRRNGRTGKAECSSLPAGILRDVGFDRATVTLRKGDIVLMFSDGVINDGLDWVCAEVEAWQDGTAQQLSDHIAAAARRRRSDGHEDDITVMAALVGKAV